MDTLDIKTTTQLSRNSRVVPYGETEAEELAAIRRLLVLGRVDEARERLDIHLDRHYGSWRTLA